MKHFWHNKQVAQHDYHKPNVAAPANYFLVTSDCICMLTVQAHWLLFQLKPIYNFLLAINCNLRSISYHFQDIVLQRPKAAIPPESEPVEQGSLPISSPNLPCQKLRYCAVSQQKLCDTDFSNFIRYTRITDDRWKKRKGKVEYLYSAFIQRLVSDMDHTVLPANYTMPAFPS